MWVDRLGHSMEHNDEDYDSVEADIKRRYSLSRHRKLF